MYKEIGSFLERHYLSNDKIAKILAPDKPKTKFLILQREYTFSNSVPE